METVNSRFEAIMQADDMIGVRVALAARDGRLRRQLEWCMYDPTYPEPSEEGDLAEVCARVADEYRLDPDAMSQVIDSCRSDLAAER